MATNINGFFTGELQPDTIIAGCINIYENAWPNPEETIKLIESQVANTDSGVAWQRAGTVGDGPYQNIRTNRIIHITEGANISNNKALQQVHNQFYLALLAATVPYTARYNIRENLFHEGYSILKYGADEEYKQHYDSGTEMGRTISVLVYLNGDYTGGELEFPYFGIKIKPEPGMMIIFPSNYAYTHIAKPVTNGTKYALVTWIKDRHVGK
jgi:predicted 2-oxoglutarate/Fe(II)-dependent dioxygenase YbiX